MGRETGIDAISALVRSYYDRVDSGDPTLFDLFHDDISYKRPGYPTITGLTDLRAFYRSVRVVDHGRHHTLSVFRLGAQAAVEGQFSGALRDGSTVELRFSDFFDTAVHARGEYGAVIIARRTYFDDTRV
ncbi:nuclear transport factor 2 family protein [Actinokineospora pegani]|uniref:nuclear transport factor 2 family protein n=1 Tax=Actinokineospora pegani TaxID=2654637 RepID=UPI0012EADAB9|nr:nuclear transport factor 2 family protein [Actinokineospora pegani]